MLEKLYAFKIMRICAEHNLTGDVVVFGDQKTTFSVEWAQRAWNAAKRGLGPPNYDDNDPALGTADFFLMCGFTGYTDIDYNGKAKLTLDLGQPVPPELHSSAALLFDGGVSEHIVAMITALSNAALIVKPGGLLVQVLPTSAFGESYYNIDPILLRDFYEANGFRTEECLLYYDRTWYYNPLRYMSFYAKEKLRAYVPNRLLEFRRKRIRESKGERVRGAHDEILSLGVLDPLSQHDVSKILVFGVPPRTHVVYTAFKRDGYNASHVNLTIQEAYPSALRCDVIR